MILVKVCYKCGQEKPIEGNFYKHNFKGSKTKDGYCNTCRGCLQVARRIRYVTKREARGFTVKPERFRLPGNEPIY